MELVVSFSSVNWSERPMLVLKNLDGTYIQPLAFAFDISAELHYNETSQLEFSIPAYVNGEETPHYKDIVGMRLIDWIGVGQFILVNPTTENDGVKEIKRCKAYSLEYELTYKSTYIPEGTYELWNPLARESTILGMILADYPSWQPGEIDEDLIGVYRTFEANSQNAYDLMKNELQDKYQCVFDFDTYSRSINVRKVSSLVSERPVYLSTQNLVKNIKVEEDTENIFTAMDVNGAEGVDILSVNPLGGNVIYNLDYFMYQTPEEIEEDNGNSYFSQTIIDKWNDWKATVAADKEQYYDITIDKVLKEAKLEMAKAELADLDGGLSSLTELQSTYVEAAAQGIDKSSDLTRVKTDIAAKNAEIATKKAEMTTLETAIAQSAAQQRTINDECSFDNFFDENEMLVIDRYFKQTSIAEDSFVYQQVDSYANADTLKTLSGASVSITGAKIAGRDAVSGGVSYVITGGSVQISPAVNTPLISATIIRASLEKKTDDTYLMTAYLRDGTYRDGGDIAFESAGLTLYGTITSFDTDVTKEHGEYIDGTSIAMSASDNSVYFTRNVGEYERRSIEWSLLEFGEQELEKLAWPSYTFDIDTANFLALEDFAAFKSKFALGDKVYINAGDKILTPIAIGVNVDFSDLSKFKLIFGDKYSLKDSAFELVDLLEQSVQMGKTVASNKLSYSAFIDSGASTAVKDYMTSALDASKQAVISGANQAVQFDGSGLRLRKATADGYDDEQIWMINNNIVFTDDGWSSAKMAIGKFTDVNAGDCWGIVAPNIVGTLLAGENLIIESAKKDGTKAVFRVDADGAKLYNSNFDLVKALQTGSNDKAWIKCDPNLGMIGGQDTVTNPLYAYDEDGNVTGVKNASGGTLTQIPSAITDTNMPNPSFWLDMKGNAFYKGTVYAEDGEFRGTVYAEDGEFRGTVYATDGEFSGTIDATRFLLDGVDISNIFKTEDDPELGDVLKIGQITIDGTTGSIRWGDVTSNPIKYMFNTTPSDTGAHSDMRSTDTYRKEKFGGGAWSAWYQFKGKDGTNGEDGYTPVKGVDYFDGTNGTDGKDGEPIEWQGSFPSAPANPKKNWAYYNTTAKASYVFNGDGWYQMSIDGVDGINGTDGKDGLSIVWKGERSTPPQNPSENWAYRDTDDGLVYIFHAGGWELMVADGNDGAAGAAGADGLSVYITYNDSESAPATPTGDGTTGGWHTNATSAVVWMSQKVAESASAGTWGTPIKIHGKDGTNGRDGRDGSDASVTFNNVNNALASLFKTWSGGIPTTMTDAYIYSPQIKGGEIYGTEIYAGQGSGFSQMSATGLDVYTAGGVKKIGMGYNTTADTDYPYIMLGQGTGYSGGGAAIVQKLGAGIWIGDDSIVAAGGNYPGNRSSAQNISLSFPHATGIFIDFNADTIYKYINGTPSHLSTATFG